MRGQRVASAGRVFNKSRGRHLLVLQLASRSRPRQHSLLLRRRCPPTSSALFASNPPAASPITKAVAAARAPMGGERSRAPMMAGLAVWASLACNVASLAYLLRSHVRRRGCAARSAAGDDAAAPRPEDDAIAALPPDTVLNLELWVTAGDPTMYEAFWREVGDRAATVIPGWQAMSYNSDAAGALCWFLEPGFEREARRLHRVVGNAVADDGYHFVVGTGATQLYQAAMYALSSPSQGDHPVPVVSPAPYYSSYPPQTDLQLSGYYRWAGDANTFTGDECVIELVCSPNNPDGAVRSAVVTSAGAKPIHDLVYYWPQYTPTTGPAAHDIMLFTVSKITGHAGTRLGWALVKDREVARRMVYFIDRSTIGVSKDSQLRATKILGVVSDAYEISGGSSSTAVPRLFNFARRRMEERWRTLRDAVAESGAFSLPEETTGYCTFNKRIVADCPAFAWLRCEKEGVEDCAEFLAGHKIMARGGEQFGGDARCVRINMLDRDRVFNLLVQRLSSIN